MEAGEKAGPAASGGDLGSTAGVMSFKQGTQNSVPEKISHDPINIFRPNQRMFLRLSFPSVTPTTSPLSILPSFVEVLGKKIDKVQIELDWVFAACWLFNRFPSFPFLDLQHA